VILGPRIAYLGNAVRQLVGSVLAVFGLVAGFVVGTVFVILVDNGDGAAFLFFFWVPFLLAGVGVWLGWRAAGTLIRE